jgi:plastocyanin
MMNRWTRRQFVRRAFVFGVGLPSVFLAACGSKDSGTAVSTSAQSAAGSTAAATGAGRPTPTGMSGMSTTGSATPAASPISAAAPTASTTGNGTPDASAVASSAPVEIKIVEPGIDYQTWTYQPNAVSVPVGTTVTWTNTGGAAHTVTADDGTSFDSGSVAPDKQFTLTMHTAGTFPYHCTFHPFMKSTITVTP